jgi:hypothetical protein
MRLNEVRFSVTSHAILRPEKGIEPSVKKMPSLLRRRASFPGKMAIEVAFDCLREYNNNIPTVFCSRHGECERSAELLTNLAQNIPLSPTSFSLSVHNATNGLFSISRQDHSNSIALAAGASTIEHAVIEACGLLADDAKAVLLVAYDNELPPIFKEFEDYPEHPYAWAWLMQPANLNNSHFISLSWAAAENHSDSNLTQENFSLAIYQFFIQKSQNLEYTSGSKHWQWKSHAKKN